jgi:hypothetical protein
MYEILERVALEEYGDVVTSSQHLGRRASASLKLRLNIRDGTYLDVWLNPTGTRYAYHWEQRAKRGMIHRHDNAPDHPHISTHPKHFHNGSEANVEGSDIPADPPAALRYFLSFIRSQLS